MVERPQFAAADYVVFALTLAFSAGIGFVSAFTGGKNKTTHEFLLANRKMYVLPAAASLLASFMSAITLLGTPSEIYRFGTLYWLIGLSYILVIPASAYIFLPVFYKLKVTSAYEYLELRFNKAVRLCGSMTFSLQMILYMAIVLYAPSLALNAVTGLNVWISVLSVGFVCILYTSLGGMKAVMWTDTFQICIMFAGLFAVLIQGSMDIGGFEKAWEVAERSGRIELWSWDPNPFTRHSCWSLIIGGFFTWLAIYGVNQAQVQRALTVPKLRQAQLAMWLNLPGLFALMALTGMAGILIYAKYEKCDPLTRTDAFRVTSADQLLPLYVMDTLHFVPGLPGLFVACLFCGALSTISSGLNSLAAVALTDVIKAYCCKNMSEARATLTSKILSFGYGLVMIGLTFVAAQLGGILQAALALFGMIGGPLLGLFTLGMIFPWANSKGALVGLFSGLGWSFWIGIGAQIYKPIVPKMPVSLEGCPIENATLANMTTTMIGTTVEMTTVAPTERPDIAYLYTLSYMWYSGFAVFVVVFVGLIVSFITGYTRPETLDPRLMVPVFDAVLCCFPKGFLKKLRCGITFKEEHISYCCIPTSKFDDDDDDLPESKSTDKLKDSSKDLEAMNGGTDNPVVVQNGITQNGVSDEKPEFHIDTRL